MTVPLLTASQTKELCKMWDFPYPYTLSKRMCEAVVFTRHMHPYPISIVRPTLITGTPSSFLLFFAVF